MDGLRELYRQFLRLPDGAILEIFGDISSAKLLPDVKASIMRRQADLEDLEETLDSQAPTANQSGVPSNTESRAQSRQPSRPASRSANQNPVSPTPSGLRSRPLSARSANQGVENSAFVEDAGESNA